MEKWIPGQARDDGCFDKNITLTKPLDALLALDSGLRRNDENEEKHIKAVTPAKAGVQ